MKNIGVIGDLHFGAAYNMGKTDPKTQLNTRLLDFERTFNQIIEGFYARDVGLVVLTGDIFETRHPTSAQLSMFAKCVRAANMNSMTLLVNVGNHDQQRNISTTTVDSFKALNIPELRVFKDFEVYKHNINNIIMLPYRDKKMMGVETNIEAIDLIEREVKALVKPLVGHKIVVGHFMLEKSDTEYDPEKFGINELVLPLKIFEGCDAIIMGHIHKHEVISKKEPAVIYSGSMEKVSFGERDHNKVSLVIYPDRINNIEIIKTRVRNLYEIGLDFSDIDDPLRETINSQIKAEIDAFDSEQSLADAIIKVSIRVREDDLYFVDQPEIKTYVKSKGANHCADVQITSLNTRQLRNSSLNETLNGKEAFRLYLDNLSSETEDDRAQIKKFAEEIIEEVEKK